jgi:hypothetical protein
MYIVAHFAEAQKNLADVSKKTTTSDTGPVQTSPARFDPETSTLSIQGKEFRVSKTRNTDAHYLLTILFRSPNETWAFDQIWEDPYFHSHNQKYNPKTDWRKIYYAGYSVNEKVQKATTIQDFLNLSKTSVSISKQYLG